MLEMDGRPKGLTWPYDRAEIIADGVVHAIGLGLGLVGAVAIFIVLAPSTRNIELASVVTYVVGLLAMLGFSAAYNLWPISRVKWWLRRFDHSAIYLLIAGTYTPFMAHLKAGIAPFMLLAGVWLAAAVGVALKVLLPGRFDRLSLGLYLLLGWSGAIAYESVLAVLPASTLWLLVAGGALYSVGLIFHMWQGLRFQNAIWHAFVVMAAACHYAAVLDYLGAAPQA